MISWLRNKLAQRKHDKIVREYREFAAGLGDAFSYSYMGDAQVKHRGKWLSIRGDEIYHALHELEVAYAELGYRIIPLDRWVDYGGWGVSIEDIWLVKRVEGERPQFTQNQQRGELPAPSPIVDMVLKTGKPVEGYMDESGEMQYRIIED